MSIVGFVGFIGSGKGSAGDILVKWGYKRDAFANPVKDACAAIFGWPRALLEGDTPQSRAFREEPDAFWSQVVGRDFTPREALQKMGTEAGRNVYHSDLWTKALERRILALQDEDEKVNVVVTDVRFNNEAKMIRELGGYVVEIQRGTPPEWYGYALELNEDNNWDGTVQKMDAYPHIHYSEFAWVGSPEITHTIQNDGDLKDLERELTKLLI